MFKSALFISDLHLNISDQSTYTAFSTFLSDTAPQYQALYILGDLFDFWIGDDDLDTPFHQRVTQQLAALANKGIQVFFMPGNRDFLIGKRFAQTAHLTLLSDPTLASIAGETFLLTHGDALCTEDKGYMRLRTVIRNSFIKWLFLLLPYRLRRKIARNIQQTGREKQQRIFLHYPYQLDVTESAIQKLLNTQNILTLIHGHTHRPAQHRYSDNKVRWVLPDWANGQGGYLMVNEEETVLKTLKHQAFPIA